MKLIASGHSPGGWCGGILFMCYQLPSCVSVVFQRLLNPMAHVYTDASGSFGYGGILMSSQWFQIQWPPAWADIDICVKELVPVVVTAALYDRSWYRQCICFHTDNMGVVGFLQRWSLGNPRAHNLLRCLYFYTALYQFDYSVEHIPGTLNTVADTLSRNNVDLFSSLVPHAVRTLIPTKLRNLLLIQQPDWGSPVLRQRASPIYSCSVSLGIQLVCKILSQVQPLILSHSPCKHTFCGPSGTVWIDISVHSFVFVWHPFQADSGRTPRPFFQLFSKARVYPLRYPPLLLIPSKATSPSYNPGDSASFASHGPDGLPTGSMMHRCSGRHVAQHILDSCRQGNLPAHLSRLLHQ